MISNHYHLFLLPLSLSLSPLSMTTPQVPLHQDIPLTPVAPSPVMINYNPHLFASMYATLSVLPPHQLLSWIEMGSWGHATTFTLETNVVKSIIILRNKKQLAQLVTEEIKITSENFVNQSWTENNLNSIAQSAMPEFLHIMQTLWNLPHYLSPFSNLSNISQNPFFTPPEEIQNNPIFFPWQP